VRVEEPNEKVSIRKEGDLLKIQVDDNGEHVKVQVPISLALSALPESGDQLSPSQAVWALQHAR
jgi:hypothetical protein